MKCRDTLRETNVSQYSSSYLFTLTCPPLVPEGILSSTLPSCRPILKPLSLISDSLRSWLFAETLVPLSLNWPWTNGDRTKGTVHSSSGPSAVASPVIENGRKETFHSGILKLLNEKIFINHTNWEHRQQWCRQLGSYGTGWLLWQSLNPLRCPGKKQKHPHTASTK